MSSLKGPLFGFHVSLGECIKPYRVSTLSEACIRSCRVSENVLNQPSQFVRAVLLQVDYLFDFVQVVLSGLFKFVLYVLRIFGKSLVARQIRIAPSISKFRENLFS